MVSSKELISTFYAPGGRLLATYDASGQPSPGYHYNLTDWLGTKRMQTTAGGNLQETCTSNPYGDGLNCTGGADATEQHFTGKDHDTESNLDYFYARYYSETLGRFMTPDWAAAPAAVPYAAYGDPQSLNLYAYVLDDPLSRTDKDGHCGELCFLVVNYVSTQIASHPDVGKIASAAADVASSSTVKASTGVGDEVGLGGVQAGAHVAYSMTFSTDGSAPVTQGLEAEASVSTGVVGVSSTASVQRQGSQAPTASAGTELSLLAGPVSVPLASASTDSTSDSTSLFSASLYTPTGGGGIDISTSNSALEDLGDSIMETFEDMYDYVLNAIDTTNACAAGPASCGGAVQSQTGTPKW